MRFIFLLTILLATAGCQKKAAAQAAVHKDPVTVSVSVDNPNKVRVGDLIRYTIEVNAQTNIDVQMPPFAENLSMLNQLLIHDWENCPEEKLPGGRIQKKQIYELETYLTGVYEIPPARIQFVINGVTNTIYSSALCVEIASLSKEGDMTDVKDVKDVVEYLSGDSGKLKVVIVLGSLAAAALVLLLFLRKKKEKDAPPPVPAHIKAFAALEMLKGSDLLKKELFKEYFSALSDILRRYIEDRFDLRAPEQTTEEFLNILRQDPKFTYEQREMLRGFLNECDLIKFAKQETSLQAAEDATEKTEAFIEATKEVPGAENNEKEGGQS